MSFTTYLYTYLVSVPVFFLIDMFWLGVVAPSLYRGYLGHLLGPVNWPVAVAFYLIFLVGLIIFAIAPALEVRSLTHALAFGALFGFFTYATYDFTNWATLKDWPAAIVFIDVVWGTVLSASVAGITYAIVSTFILR